MKPEEVKAELQQLAKSSEMLRTKIQLLADLKENINTANYDGIKVSGTKKRDLSDLMVQIEQLEAEILEETDKNMAERLKWVKIFMHHLKGDQFDAFLYKYLSISYNNNSDIAKRMKCTQENVRKLLMRGFEKLAKNIQ